MGSPHRIVVGIDFGTTYSAAGWSESGNPNHIELLRNWPTSGQMVGLQAPTEIAYKPEDTTQYSWGYDIDPRAKKIKWFKLGLEMEQEGVFALPAGMTAADVVQDYLAGLYKHIMTTLSRRFDKGIVQSTRIDFVLTVPAIWSDAAKQKMRKAAATAGMGNEHQLILLSEPESAALYTLKGLHNANAQVNPHDRIVVCDAGGGTVDLITYDVEQIFPNLSVKECTAGTGDLCGSTFIDNAFSRLFERRMGTHFSKLQQQHVQQVMKSFEPVKIAFRDDDSYPTYWITVPTVGDIEEAGVVGGSFAVSQQEMRDLFDPVVDKIINLIKDQIQLSTSSGTEVINSILLVGGFGESEYLYQCVSAWASKFEIQTIQPRDASTAIVRGAVIKGMEPTAGPSKSQVLRRARRSYGVPTNRPYVPGLHSPEDMYVDPDSSQRLARNQVSWFIRKNDLVGDEQTFRHAFSRHFRGLEPWVDSLVSSTLEVPPQRASDPSVHRHCTITSDLTHLPKRAFKRRWRKLAPYYTADYELLLQLRGNELCMALQFNNREYGLAQVEFEQEQM